MNACVYLGTSNNNNNNNKTELDLIGKLKALAEQPILIVKKHESECTNKSIEKV